MFVDISDAVSNLFETEGIIRRIPILMQREQQQVDAFHIITPGEFLYAFCPHCQPVMQVPFRLATLQKKGILQEEDAALILIEHAP